MRYFIIMILFVPIYGFGQSFETYFEDKTLRLDYVFAGDANVQEVFLDEMVQLSQWAGRNHNLNEAILDGNAQIRVYDVVDGALLYVQGFSTLFQEWLSTPESKLVKKSFEVVLLVPFPKKDVWVEVVLFDDKGIAHQKIKHRVDPRDMLIRTKGAYSAVPYRVLQQAKTKNAIEVAFVAEGFTEKTMDHFYVYAQTAMEQILMHSPFDSFADRFTFYAVGSVSDVDGVSVPRANDWKKTALESHFDTFYSERYLTTPRMKKLHDLVAGIPYEHLIVLANTEVYGGGGIYNAYTLTTTGNPKFKPVVVHEFGHSFAGLADEYFYESDVLSDLISTQKEPWEQNITTLVDFDSKWKGRLVENTPIPTGVDKAGYYPIGVYEGLAGGKIYKASVDCRMKTNEYDRFCPICQRAIENLIRFYTD